MINQAKLEREIKAKEGHLKALKGLANCKFVVKNEILADVAINEVQLHALYEQRR